MDPAITYAASLVSQNNGRPLWTPESSVEIGDVGYLDTSSGKFIRLMNVLRSADDPLNELGVPGNYEPLVLRVQADFIPMYLNSGSLHSLSVQEEVVEPAFAATGFQGNGFSAKYSFTCSAQCGAVLLLANGADRCHHMCSAAFEEYMVKYYDSWCQLADDRGYRIGDPALLGPILIKGWIKAPTWGVAALCTAGQSRDIQLKGEIGGHLSSGVSFSSTNGNAQHRCGPYDSNSQSSFMPFSNRGRNSCVSISYFQAKKRVLLPHNIIAGAGEQAHSESDDHPDQIEIESVPTSTTYRDAMDDHLDRMLQESSADIVVACTEDVDWHPNPSSTNQTADSHDSSSFEIVSVPTSIAYRDAMDAHLDRMLQESSADIVVASTEDVDWHPNTSSTNQTVEIPLPLREDPISTYRVESVPTSTEYRDAMDDHLDRMLQESSADIVVACTDDVDWS